MQGKADHSRVGQDRAQHRAGRQGKTRQAQLALGGGGGVAGLNRVYVGMVAGSNNLALTV